MTYGKINMTFLPNSQKLAHFVELRILFFGKENVRLATVRCKNSSMFLM